MAISMRTRTRNLDGNCSIFSSKREQSRYDAIGGLTGLCTAQPSRVNVPLHTVYSTSYSNQEWRLDHPTTLRAPTKSSLSQPLHAYGDRR